MKAALASAAIIGAASAAWTPPQQIMQAPKAASDAFAKPLESLQDHLKGLTGEARALWDEMTMMFPESVEKASFLSAPKPHSRRPDSEWDHVVSGKAVQDIWVENAKGEKEREVGGNLENFNLRVKKVDPSVLNVDKVKQYSGYLDDEEEDKHLFYCTRHQPQTPVNHC